METGKESLSKEDRRCKGTETGKSTESGEKGKMIKRKTREKAGGDEAIKAACS